MLLNVNKSEFRKIPSLDNLYEISADGEIFRNVKTQKLSKIHIDYHHSLLGYKYVFLTYKGKSKRVSIAKVVAECWLGEKPNGYLIHHIDGDSQNDHYTNLKYISPEEQKKIRADEGVTQIGINRLNEFRKKRMKPVVILDGSNRMEFESVKDGAQYLSTLLGMNFEHIRSKMRKKESFIYNHTVIYKNSKLENGEK